MLQRWPGTPHKTGSAIQAHEKTFSAASVIKEVQCKTTTRHYHTLIRAAVVKRLTLSSVGTGGGGTRILWHSRWEHKMVQPCWKGVCRSLRSKCFSSFTSCFDEILWQRQLGEGYFNSQFQVTARHGREIPAARVRQLFALHPCEPTESTEWTVLALS